MEHNNDNNNNKIIAHGRVFDKVREAKAQSAKIKEWAEFAE